MSGEARSTSRPVLVVKTGSTFPALEARKGDFESWILGGLGLPSSVAVDVVAVHEGEVLPEAAPLGGVVITGSSSMVSDRNPWSESAIDWLQGVLAAEVPCLGICYGHQMLARAAGAAVGPNPRGREIGTRCVSMSGHEDDPLLSVVPEVAWVHTTHVESVLEAPPGAVVRGTTELDPHHAFSLGERAWGVQFHPEFDESIMRFYIEERRELVRAEGLNPDALLDEVRPAPTGGLLLQRFGELVRRFSASG